MERKGVYMDGHEWADVVEYGNQTFLPMITKYEALVATYVSFSTMTNVIFTLMMRQEISGEFVHNI